MNLNFNSFSGRFLPLVLALFLGGSLSAQATLNGTITDNSQEGLIGASVFVTGTSSGAVTDFDGNYSLKIPAGTYTIRYSYTGFRTMEKSFTFTDGQTITENIVLATDNLSLDEVVVTGSFTGRTQKASPMSITLLNAEQIQRLSSNSQADILRAVPGITAEGGGGEVASNIFVRGLPSGGQYQFTPLQVDGMPVLSTFGLNSSAHDVYFRNDIGIRNLEFTRGGSSTLFGAGSVAGIINYSSINGTATPDNKVQLEWAEGGRAKLDVLSSGPLAENLFYAVSGFYRYDEGPLKTGLATRGHQVRANIKKLFNDGASSFTVYAQSIDDNVQFYLPYPLANDNGQRERPIGNDGETVFTTLTDQATGYSFDTPYGRFESPIADGVTTKGGYIMAHLNHTFDNDWRLSAKAKSAKYEHGFNLFLDGDGVRNVPESQATYINNRELGGNASFTYVDDGTALASGDLLFENRILDRDRPMEEVVGEVQFTKTVGKHSFSFGTFASDTRAEDNNWILNYLGDFRNAPRTVNLTYTDDNGEDIVYSTGGFINGRQTSNNTLRSTKVAFYAGDQYQGERFSFDIGLRWENATGKIEKENGVGSNNFLKGTVSASDVAVALAGLYEVNEDLNIYANASRGYFFPELRGVGFSSAGQALSYEPEAILQGELGAKYGKNKFAATAALYYVTLKDRRSVDFVNDPNTGNVIEQVRLQDTRTFGIEASMNYAVSDNLNLYGNVTLQDHQFTKVEGNEEQVGNELRRQPNAMGTLGGAFDNGSFDAGISANLLGSKFANDANTVELDGYNIVRLDGGYTFDLGKKQTLRLGLQVFNLLDSDGVTEGSPRQADNQGGGISDFFVGRPILPRRIFLRALFDF